MEEQACCCDVVHCNIRQSECLLCVCRMVGTAWFTWREKYLQVEFSMPRVLSLPVAQLPGAARWCITSTCSRRPRAAG